MPDKTKKITLKSVIYLAAVVLFVLLLIFLLKPGFISMIFEKAKHQTNVPEIQKEIEGIIDANDFSVISFMNVNYNQGVYTVSFYCEKLNINNTAGCNTALTESVKAFERIVSETADSSELYDKKICLRTRINGQLPYIIELCNYEHDYGRINEQLKEPDFKKLISVYIDFPVDDISVIDKHKEEIIKIGFGSNCKAGNLGNSQSEKSGE